jgi:hypothetical protein
MYRELALDFVGQEFLVKVVAVRLVPPVFVVVFFLFGGSRELCGCGGAAGSGASLRRRAGFAGRGGGREREEFGVVFVPERLALLRCSVGVGGTFSGGGRGFGGGGGGTTRFSGSPGRKTEFRPASVLLRLSPELGDSSGLSDRLSNKEVDVVDAVGLSINIEVAQSRRNRERRKVRFEISHGATVGEEGTARGEGEGIGDVEGFAEGDRIGVRGGEAGHVDFLAETGVDVDGGEEGAALRDEKKISEGKRKREKGKRT